MDAKDVIDNVHELYDRFKTPPNLRRHMVRVAAVADLICEEWQGPEIERNNIVAVSLLHDLGNIMKMDFEQGIHLLDDEERAEEWKEVQEEVREEYGEGHHEVTLNMARELDLSDRLIWLLDNKEFVKEDFVMKSDDYSLIL